MKDSAADAAKGLAASMVKQSVDAAGQTLKNAVDRQPRRQGGDGAAGGPRQRKAAPPADAAADR